MEDCIKWQPWQNMWKMTARNHRELKLKSKLKKQPRNVAGANRDSSQSNGRLYYRLFFFLPNAEMQYIWFSNLK